MSRRPRILFYYSLLVANGGASSVAVWMLQALREQYDVTVLTWEEFDLPAMNEMFGTSLQWSDFKLQTVPRLTRKFIELDPDRGSIQRHIWLMRMCKQMASEYDLVVSADNEGDFGPPALQYIHWPFLAHVYPRLAESCDLPPVEKMSAVFRGTLRPWMLLGDFSFTRMKKNHTLANSNWTAGWIQRIYGIESTTVTPPASGDFPDIAWEQRQDGFVMIGRFCGGKRYEWVIQVLDRVRKKVPQIQLHIVGTVSVYNADQGYFESLAPLLREHASWVTVHRDLPRSDLARLLASQRYGVHAMLDEHFGMAVAEIVAAGCIPFVHNSGGPPETVGNDPRLLFTDEDDAAEKIQHVLSSPEATAHIQDKLAKRRRAYTTEAFMRAIRREVNVALGAAGRSLPESPA